MRVPEEKNTPLTFLQSVLAGRKKLFPLAKTISIENPGWLEFSNKKVWAEAVKNPRFKEYIPDNWKFEGGGRHPEKDYSWVVICTLQPDWVHENIDRIRAARYQYQVDGDSKRPPDTYIDPAWVQKLLSVPFIPCKHNNIFIPFPLATYSPLFIPF